MSLKNLIFRANKRYKEKGLINLLYLSKRFFIYWCIKKIRELKYRFLRFKSKNRFLLKDIQGNKMYIDLEDVGISLDLYFDGIREVDATKTMEEELEAGDTVVDIGANIGYYALMEARLVGESGKVYAIEPIPKNVEMLKRNIEINGYRNIEVFQMAIGDEDKKAKIYLSPKSNWHSMLLHKDFKVIGSIDVDTYTLDILLKNKNHPNFVRMDVEGYEYEIIGGMKKIIEERKPLKLFIEIHPHIIGKEKTISLLKTLQKFGFQTKKIIKSYTVIQLKYFTKTLRNYPHKTIDDLLQDDSILNGESGAFQIFFERK